MSNNSKIFGKMILFRKMFFVYLSEKSLSGILTDKSIRDEKTIIFRHVFEAAVIEASPIPRGNVQSYFWLITAIRQRQTRKMPRAKIKKNSNNN